MMHILAIVLLSFYRVQGQTDSRDCSTIGGACSTEFSCPFGAMLYPPSVPCQSGQCCVPFSQIPVLLQQESAGETAPEEWPQTNTADCNQLEGRCSIGPNCPLGFMVISLFDHCPVSACCVPFERVPSLIEAGATFRLPTSNDTETPEDFVCRISGGSCQEACEYDDMTIGLGSYCTSGLCCVHVVTPVFDDGNTTVSNDASRKMNVTSGLVIIAYLLNKAFL